MAKRLTEKSAEIVILQKNLKDLQGQLANAQKRILELIQDKDSANEELIKERQLLLELEGKVNRKQIDTTEAIEKQIEDWPEVVDSKPEKSFKPRKVASYLVKEGEKWTRVKEDGTIEYTDIQPGEWD